MGGDHSPEQCMDTKAPQIWQRVQLREPGGTLVCVCRGGGIHELLVVHL